MNTFTVRCIYAVHESTNGGRTNRVAFDPSKEHVVIIHPALGEGDPFKLLGLLVDCKLVMDSGIERILAQARPKIRAIIRTRPHYSVAELITQFKTHIWGITEIHNGGIFHASNHLINRFDDSQRHFLENLGIDERYAFLDIILLLQAYAEILVF